jgi:arylsulfatase A-like enzyme
MKIEDYNVIFITLDSLPYQTAVLSPNLFLNKISTLKKAETHGTYTYPAHHSFFIGLIPRLIGNSSNKYLGKYSQIWRNNSANQSEKKVAIFFKEKSIIDFYKNKNHQTIGFGGVEFFNTYKKSNTLPNLFEEFVFFGPKEKLDKLERIPRSPNWFPLNNLDYITHKIKDNPFFLFINSIATHIPYDNPNTHLSDNDKKIIAKIYREHDLKIPRTKRNIPISSEEILRIRKIQQDSFSWADTQIKKLIDLIPRKRPTILIVCSDHGEEFGEFGRFGHAHFARTIMYVPYWDCILDKNS